ncbi:RNA polymerase sigma-70 factor [Pedobacter gandavensis]|uniref:RNA polymerase sigma factor n=1 Tax=Pedobacter gandavensis TaxID=2679963 RepID=UPI00292F294B|nr:RNA polymerase sigma-70 factor [Pedobacter gandavensis]
MAAYSTHSDQELAVLLNAGNHTAFAEIYKRYSSVLFLHARHMLREEEGAKDVIQELFATVWSNYNQIDLSINLSAYLYKSVRNIILNMVRHDKVKEAYLADLGTFVEQGTVQTDELVRYKDLKRRIEEEIRQMPPKMRVIFELSRNENLTHGEIAARLGISTTTVKKQVSNAVGILRKKFKLPMAIIFMLLK